LNEFFKNFKNLKMNWQVEFRCPKCRKGAASGGKKIGTFETGVTLRG
jgi:hypothetical protein